MAVFESCHYCILSPQGRINEGKALDRKPVARSLNLPSIVWAVEPRTIDSRGEH